MRDRESSIQRQEQDKPALESSRGDVEAQSHGVFAAGDAAYPAWTRPS